MTKRSGPQPVPIAILFTCTVVIDDDFLIIRGERRVEQQKTRGGRRIERR